MDAAGAGPGHRSDAPDPGAPRVHRPPRRGRPAVRDGRRAPRSGRPRSAVPARLAAGARVAVGRRAHPRRGAAAGRARVRARAAAGPRAGIAAHDASTTRRPWTAGRVAGRWPGRRRGRSGRAGRGRGHHLGAVRGGQGHHHRGHAPRARAPDRHYVITCTTRDRRWYEEDGVDYHFLTRAAFDAKLRERVASWRPPRSTATGTARPVTRSRRRSRRARTRSSRSMSRAPSGP